MLLYLTVIGDKCTHIFIYMNVNIDIHTYIHM